MNITNYKLKNNIMKPEELIEKKVYGFEFVGHTMLKFSEECKQVVGKIGKIKKYDKTDNTFLVSFRNGESFYYPADQIEAHLVEENEIPTLTDGVAMLVSDNDITYEEELVFFKHNGQYYAKIGLSFEPYKYCKPLEPTKEEQLTAILGSSDKVAEIMELFNDKK